MANALITENQNTGTTAWNFAPGTFTKIQAYADKVSLDPGDTITFYASTQTAGTSYSINIYRLGWYSGTGGRLMTTISGLTGVAQGYWDLSALQNCPTAILDNSTHNLEAGWASVASWAVPSSACTGAYLAVFTDSSNNNWGVPFFVRGNSGAEYLVVYSDTTDAAYNDWGGYSLYTNPTVGVKVSFNRPSAYRYGTGKLMYYALQSIRWLEMQGYNLTYRTIRDIHSNPSQLLSYKAVLYPGHNEYWTKEVRDGAEAAISAGVSAAFLGANASYWQCRLEADHAGNANNTMTCYKVQTANSNLSLDPLYGVDTPRVTSKWRDAVINRPENAMIGIMYSHFNSATQYAWTVDASADTTYFAGTGLALGQSYGSNLVGYEWDKIQAGGPSNLKTIGTSTATAEAGDGGAADTSNTTFYKATSGALVFATGSMQWTWALDTYRWQSTGPTVPGMQTLLSNMMAAFKGPVFSMVGVGR